MLLVYSCSNTELCLRHNASRLVQLAAYYQQGALAVAGPGTDFALLADLQAVTKDIVTHFANILNLIQV